MAVKQDVPLTFWQEQSVLKNIKTQKQLIIFLDYDGTLTPIVDTPDQAVISQEMRQAVLQLSEHRSVSIVSGRATSDVRSKVLIDNIYYAGSHGFEILTPQGKTIIQPDAENIIKDVEKIYAQLSEKTRHVKGALIENVKFTVSAHYRLIPDKDLSAFEHIVCDVLNDYPNFRRTNGKKVIELRPNIDWDKGKAVKWILTEIQQEGNFPVYIGDDQTDEDAFKVIAQEHGIGILVSDPVRQSYADYYVKNVNEVKKLLELML